VKNDKKIGVGIVGVHPENSWASIAHIPALQLLPEFAIAAVSHHNLALAQSAAEKFDIAKAFGTSEDLVNDPDVDLVVVSVKVTRHMELITIALEAGKSVLCEWPLATSLGDAIKISELADAKGVHAAIGLQTRATPSINYIRDLIKDGYAGEVLSTTLIGSGILWGDAMNETYRYTLDPSNGAAMLQVPFAHSLDGVLYGLDTRFSSLQSNLFNRRKTVRIIETGDEVPMPVPDQIAVSGVLENGAFINVHFRGGLSRASNFHWEINGTQGDLILTTPVGYSGVGGFRLQGARGAETLRDLAVPESYGKGLEPCITQSMAVAYQRLASDMKTGTHLAPTFEDAVGLHRLIAEIEKN
jgi:predicted dehydrogenase